jgi:hypothetical protein
MMELDFELFIIITYITTTEQHHNTNFTNITTFSYQISTVKTLTNRNDEIVATGNTINQCTTSYSQNGQRLGRLILTILRQLLSSLAQGGHHHVDSPWQPQEPVSGALPFSTTPTSLSLVAADLPPVLHRRTVVASAIVAILEREKREKRVERGLRMKVPKGSWFFLPKEQEGQRAHMHCT